MMDKMKIDWEYCYGIKSLKHEFSFSEGKHSHLIYAPNGTMKTSFAKTMKFLSGQTKEKPCDQLCEANKAKYSLTTNEKDISPDFIFVVNGDEDIDYSKSFVNFLASAELKSKYDEIYLKLTTGKDALISKLKSCSQSADCEKEIIEAFSQGDSDTIFSILEWLSLKIQPGLPLFDFRYNDVFDTKGAVKAFLETHRDKLKEYIDNYEKLLNESCLYRAVDGHSFGTYQASQLLQNVSDGNFFGVHHKMILQNGDEITSHEELQQKMTDEQNRVLGDEKLKKVFEKITKAIDKNAELRGFKKVIESHPEWIGEMLHYEEFRQKVWLGFLSKDDIKPIFESYLKVYNENKDDLINVLEEAEKQQAKWKDIITLYNARFHVPIKVSIENQRDIILKQDAAKLQFSYIQDGEEPIVKEKKDLDKILSRGEKRAFIILQFLFEMESRKLLEHETIVVMDDIADSFDYQNKYAIVEYIKDLSESSNIYLLILTHNYDFYRTLTSRLSLKGDALWMVERSSDNSVVLLPGQYRGNVFAKAFIGKDENNKIFISMIPFVRNLIEYTKGVDSTEYITLTDCLHHKKDTKDITDKEVMDILKNYTLGKGLKRQSSNKKIYSLIMSVAESIVQEEVPDPILIENKIALSIGIRHLAENYMHDKIISTGKSEEDLLVNGNQTGKWTGLYKKCCPDDENKVIIERVNMMTPEIIHINSFMFEPLIDMSISHLIALYKDCKEHLII